MEIEAILTKVREAISRELEIEPGTLTDQASLRKVYGLDSVAAVNIIFFLERELNVEIDIKQFVGVDSIDDLRGLLARSMTGEGGH
jgi:acyl carrier protein